MTPKKVTIESEMEAQKKTICDQIITRAANMMLTEVDAPMEMMLDRVLTFFTAHACTVGGSAATAAMFRQLADKVDAGLFSKLTGENDENQKSH